MAENSAIEWTDHTFERALRGPAPKPPRDGDRKQARQRINVLVRTGKLAHPNKFACVDCGHQWKEGERRHEYDHYRGYAAEHHYDVEPVCTTCHAIRDSARKSQQHCKRGHEYTPENTIIKSNGTRWCRECRKLYDRARKRPSGYWKAVNERRRQRGHG